MMKMYLEPELFTKFIESKIHVEEQARLAVIAERESQNGKEEGSFNGKKDSQGNKSTN